MLFTWRKNKRILGKRQRFHGFSKCSREEKNVSVFRWRETLLTRPWCPAVPVTGRQEARSHSLSQVKAAIRLIPDDTDQD